eukprot:scaffold15497_cov117-Cylindrotheca_fusiformis.AAC.15
MTSLQRRINCCSNDGGFGDYDERVGSQCGVGLLTSSCRDVRTTVWSYRTLSRAPHTEGYDLIRYWKSHYGTLIRDDAGEKMSHFEDFSLE